MPAGRPKALNPWEAGRAAFREGIAVATATTHPTERLLDFCELMDPGFRKPRHLAVLIDHLEALERRDINRLMVFMPPRSGKTRLTSQLYPAYWLGKHPRDQVILLSYGSDLAEESSAVARDYLKDSLWPFKNAQLSPTTRATSRWKTTQGGICVGVGFGGVLGGRGADLLNIDDPTKNLEDAQNVILREKQKNDWRNVVRPRLMYGAAALLTTTRWVVDDLAGWLLNEPNAAEWVVLSLPLWAGENDALGRAPGEFLWLPGDEPFGDIPTEEEIGRRAFAALYQQSPIVEGGNYFTEELWTADNPVPSLRPFPSDFKEPREDGRSTFDRLRRYQFWDVAFSEAATADYTVCITIGVSADLDIYVLDVTRKHLSPFTMGQEMGEQYKRWLPVAVGIEQNTFREKVIDDLVRQLRSRAMARVLPVPVDRDKQTRAGLPRERAEAGKLFVDRSALWYPVFRDELLAFPGAKFDDQVDALSGICELIRTLGSPQQTKVSQYRVGRYQTKRKARSASSDLWTEITTGKVVKR